MYDNLSICKIRHDRCLAFYNGSVSSMTWVMTGDATVRGYKYTYNDYGWLTAATYGEGLAVSANKDRYSEKISGFTRNGSITGFQRHGNMASSNFGKIDDLTITYSGNRISTVKDASLPVTQNGSMDYPGGSTPKSFEYNAFGAIVKDESRGITAVTYDNFGNPLSTMFSSGVGMKNVYSATGEKLKTLTITNATRQADAAIAFEPEMDMLSLDDSAAASGVMAQSTTEYHGPIIYRDGKVDMVLFPGGYATVNGSAVTFHYYTQDYLGNNRAVINGSTGAIEQTVAYYPYGAVIADLGTNATKGQPYKFGGKELITANGLNEYDFGARQYYSAVPAFTSIDPLCEDATWLSPYLYCGNNPVNAIDPDGRRTLVTDQGNGRYMVIGGTLDDDLNIYLNDKNGSIIGVTTSNTSFYNSDKGEWAISSVIDINDRSGADFLNNLEFDTPNIANYMWNARGNHKYDFKNTNGTDKKIDNMDQYRGMQIGSENGIPLITSARDIGNIGAGYMAGVNGISWDNAVIAFDAYQTYTDLSPSLQQSVIDGAISFLTGDPGGLKKVFFPLIQNKVSEGISTRNAERYGWEKGNAVYHRSK